MRLPSDDERSQLSRIPLLVFARRTAIHTVAAPSGATTETRPGYLQAMALPAARLPRIRSWVSAPVSLSDGSLYGTFCAFGFTSDPELTTRDDRPT